jgi:hypothetical protein
MFFNNIGISEVKTACNQVIKERFKIHKKLFKFNIFIKILLFVTAINAGGINNNLAIFIKSALE